MKSTPSTSGCSASARPVSARPCTISSTPSGRPARRQARAIHSATAGASSLGFNTTVLPVASAGTMWPFGRWAGKLKGPSTASTPRGWKLRARAGARFDRRDEAHAVLERHVDLGGDQRGLGARVPERLAHLARDEARQLLGALPDELGEAAQDPRARLEAGVAPGREGAARARDRGVDLGFARDREASDLVGGIGGRDAHEPLAHAGPSRQRRHVDAVAGADAERLATLLGDERRAGLVEGHRRWRGSPRGPRPRAAPAGPRIGATGSPTRPGSTSARRSRTDVMASRAAP